MFQSGIAAARNQVGEASTSVLGRRWIRFVWTFAVTLVAALTAVAVLNLAINPSALYPPGLFVPFQPDTRSIKFELLANAKPKPSVLILGSSRVMNILPRDVERTLQSTTFNGGVSAGNLEDAYAVLRFAERVGIRPRLVLLGLDLTSLDQDTPPEFYLMPPAAASVLPNQWMVSYLGEKTTSAVSVRETKLSLLALWFQLRGKSPSQNAQYSADGGIVWTYRERRRLTDPSPDIVATLREYRPIFAALKGISAQRTRTLEMMLQYCQQHSIKLIIFLTPWHPAVIADLESLSFSERHEQVALTISHLAGAYDAKFLDLTDPSIFTGDVSGFYDGVHIDSKLSGDMLSWILAHVI